MNETVSQNVTLSNKEFLNGVMGDYYKAAHVTGFIEDPAELDALDLRHYWGGTIWAKNPIENPDQNNFFTISTFYPDPEDGKNRRRKANFAAAYCMMIDDIGSGEGAKISDIDMLSYPIVPSWRIETSPDNFQYGYIFDYPEMDRGTIEALLKGLVALDLVNGGGDPGMLGCTRYARLPVGSNTKAKYGQPFRHVLHEWRPDRRYTVGKIAESFGIDLKYHATHEDYAEPLSEELDYPLQSLKRLGLTKAKLREGIWDITCPWQDEHSGELDNGTAYLSPMGFKCHHGHCADKTGKNLLNWLHGNDPVYAEACQVTIPFVAQRETASESTFNDPDVTDTPTEFRSQFDEALNHVNPSDPASSQDVYKILASYLPHLTPTEKDHYLKLIKENTLVTIKVAREQLKHTRTEMLREHREKGILHEPAWKTFNEDRIVPCLDNFKAICEFHGIHTAYNQMSHTIDVNIPKHDFSGEDLNNRTLMFMRDLVQNYGIPFSRVDEWMMGYAHEHAYHPFRDYLDSLDGVSFDPKTPYFNKLVSTLEFDEFPDQSEQFVRRWLISVVAAVRGHGGAGMKGVLTFAGKQGIGKTSWFRNLIPDGMFSEGLVLDPHNKDTLIKATNYLVCELGELDATFKRDIPALKAFISSQTDEIRHPYAPKTSTHPRRTVFCATVNQTNFLVDQTGNSRFWPVQVLKTDFLAVKQMKDSGELHNFWREIDMMYQACIAGRQEFRWWIGYEESDMLSEVSERFIRESAGESMLRESFDMDAPAIHWLSTTEIMHAVGLRMSDHNYVAKKNEVLESLRRITGQGTAKRFQRNGAREYGYKMPQHKVSKIKPVFEAVPEMPKADYDFM